MSLIPIEPGAIASAVRELASRTELPEDVVHVSCDLLRQIGASRAVQSVGGAIGDVFSWWRWRNRILIAHRAAVILERDRISRRVVPPAFLLPLLDEAGNAEDPDLREMWAQLLASGVEADAHQHPMWVRVLAQMSGEDAREFRAVCRRTDLDGVAFVRADDRLYGDADAPTDAGERIVALGLALPVAGEDPGPSEISMRLTRLGAQFRQAIQRRGADARAIGRNGRDPTS